MDGANCGFRFDDAGEPYAQSRGHYLDLRDRSNWRERHWNLLKEWLLTHQGALLDRFEDRYLVYGEWMGAAHTVFYDRLPHLFLEFDIYDLAQGCFLDTAARRGLCRGLPIASVPVLYRGPARDAGHLAALAGPSAFVSPGDGDAGWEGSLRRACALVDDDYGRRLAKMDRTGRAEGIYAKAEADGRVVARCKWVRDDFTQKIAEADEHWLSRIPVPNLLDGPADIFPAHLARTPAAPPAYDPDAPWAWSPWIVARPVPAPV